MSRLLITLLLLCCAAGRLGAATPQEYDRALAAVQAAITRQTEALDADVVASGPSPSLVAQSALGPIHAVGLPGGVPTLVNTAPLVAAAGAAEALRDPEAKSNALDSLDSQIGTLRSALAKSPATLAPADAKASARAVLAGPEFASDPPPPPSIADKLAAWLDKLFQRRNPAPTPNVPNANPAVIQGILIVIAVGAFAVLVAVLVQAIGRREARAKPLALDAEEAVLVEARDNNSLLALAEQSAHSGDYRRAFRLVYLASLVALDTNGVLRFDRSKTNWEYLRALRASGRGDVYTALTPLTREFDQVWYGFAPADRAQYARALAQYEALQAAPAQAATSQTNPAGVPAK